MARLIPMMFALVLIFGLALGTLSAENEEKEFPEQSPEEKVATMKLWTKQRQQESGEFTEHFSKNWDKETDAARAAFCKLAGRARAKDAIPLLVEHLDFLYFGEFPTVHRFPRLVEGRLALEALIEIGIPSLEPAVARILKMIDELPEKETDDSRHQAAFLRAAIKELTTKILGKDLAVAYLKTKLEDKDLSEKARAVVESTLNEIKPPEEQADKP